MGSPLSASMAVETGLVWVARRIYATQGRRFKSRVPHRESLERFLDPTGS